MATVNASGDLQLEHGDVLPREIAVKDDDPAYIRTLITALNSQKPDADTFAKFLKVVDHERAEFHKVENPDLLPENQ